VDFQIHEEHEQAEPPQNKLDLLLQRACSGDREAFGQIYSKFHGELVGYLFFRVRDRETAEDLAQQIFIKIWQRLPSYEHRGYFKAWLYRVARNHLVDHYRTQRTSLSIDGVDLAEPEETEQMVIWQETYRDLERAIDSLPVHYRDVLIFRFMMGLSAKEVGVRMNRSADAVRALQVRAICALRDAFVERGAAG
jgi:RNA polymerase sigma-70 factor, ECF subfamily